MATGSAEIVEVTLKVSESVGKDVGRGIARIDPADMERLGIDVGDTVEVVGHRGTICKVLPTFKQHRGKCHVQIDGIARGNCGSGIGEPVILRPVAIKPASQVVLTPQGASPSSRDLEYIGSRLDGLPAIAGDRVRATLFGSRYADFVVESTVPAGPVGIVTDSLLKIGSARKAEGQAAGGV